MTKDEAFKAMQGGEKVKHKHFSADEWVMLTGSIFEFEDGCFCHIAEFWVNRTDESWDSGWGIFREPDYVDDSFKEILEHNSPLKEQAI